MEIRQHIRIAPFVRIFPLFALGILFSQLFPTPIEWSVVISTGLYLFALLLRKSIVADSYLAGAIFATGVLLGTFRSPQNTIPTHTLLRMLLEIQESPIIRGKWQQSSARVIAVRPLTDTTDSWSRVSERIHCYIDTSLHLSVGEQWIVQGYLHPIDTTGSRYGALMRCRGFFSRCYISPKSLVTREEQAQYSLLYLSSKLQEKAIERLSKLALSSESQSILLGMVAGERRTIPPSLREAYAQSGVAHILAISGLHMGFILLFANLLFGSVVFLPQGHRIKNLIVIIFLWFYAVTVGASPSVLRATLMLSAAQIALSHSIRTQSYNLLLGAATLMLAIHPTYLFDVSFQLSFAAVLGIFFIYPRLYRHSAKRNPIIDLLICSLAISLAAQLAVTPLLLYHFGNFSLYSLLINPPVMLTAFLVISIGLLWLLAPIPWLSPLFSSLLERILTLQNGMVEWFASIPHSSVRINEVNGWIIMGCYLIFIALCVIIKMSSDEKEGKNTLRIRKKSRIFASRS